MRPSGGEYSLRSLQNDVSKIHAIFEINKVKSSKEGENI
jgi:hypothetical protein